jgi:hypothetical protein
MVLSAERFWPVFAFVLMALSSFVQNEPAPYDFLLIAAMVGILFLRPKLPVGLFWPAICILMVLAGYAVGAMFAISYDEALDYMRTSAFLSLSLLFVATLVWRQPEKVTMAIVAGVVVSSVIASIIGILGYFNMIPNAQVYALYGRATGTFKDPNVFGPSLVFPALYMAQRLAFRSWREMWWSLPVLVILLLGLFLSFSRGAWIDFAMATVIFFSVCYATADAREKGRMLRFFFMLLGILTIAVLWVLSIPGVRKLFLLRFQLVQNYDTGEGGRLDNMLAAFMMALKHPLGIGPYQWPLISGLMPHNTYVNVFVSGGVLSLIGFSGLMLLTLWVGFRTIKLRPPVYEVYVAALGVFAGHVFQNFQIDTNHWRHLYIVGGLVWGLALAADSRERAFAMPRTAALSSR